MHLEKFPFLAALLLSISYCVYVRAGYVENSKFCIHTDVLPLIDTKDHINPQLNDPKCEIFVNTLSVEEKAQLIKTLCKSPTTDYHFLKIRNGDLSDRGSNREFCDEKRNPLLAWIPFSVVQKNFIYELNPNVKSNYLAKARKELPEDESNNFCYFAETNLTPDLTRKDALQCYDFDNKDTFFGVSNGIEVLVEVLPLMYELRNVTYEPWVNSTVSYKTRLGETTLKNPRNEAKQIYGSINYGYVEKVKLNTKSVYGDNLEPLPLLFQHRGALLELDSYGIGGIDVQEKAYFGRVMDPKSTVQVEVIGQWAEHQQQFNAVIYEYFGYGIRRMGDTLQNGKISFVLIESTEPVYDQLDASHRVLISLHTERPPTTAPPTDEPLAERVSGMVTNAKPLIKKEKPQMRQEETSSSGHPYPGFFPWFVGACLIVGGVAAVILFNVLRHMSHGKNKHEYKKPGA